MANQVRIQAEFRRVHLFSRAFPAGIHLRAIGSMRQGDWVLAGSYDNSPVLDGVQLSAGNSTLLVLRMTRSGQIAWRFTAASTNGAPGLVVNDLSVGDDDTVYLGAEFANPVTIGSSTLTPQSSNGNAVLLAIEPQGGLRWVVPLYSMDQVRIRSLVATGGAIVAAGTHRGVALGSLVLQPPAAPWTGPSAFVVSVTDAGVPGWLVGGWDVRAGPVVGREGTLVDVGTAYAGVLSVGPCNHPGSTSWTTPAVMRWTLQGACVDSSASRVSGATLASSPTLEFVSSLSGAQLAAAFTSGASGQSVAWGGTGMFAPSERGAVLARVAGPNPDWVIRGLGNFPASGARWDVNILTGGVLETENVWQGIVYDDFQIPNLGSVGAALFLLRDGVTGQRRFHFLIPGTATADPMGPTTTDLTTWEANYRILGQATAPVDFGGGPLNIVPTLGSSFVVEVTE
ncbi:MAG: hypothetical protein HY906_06365 [Deltaproteobacteria bacterium]|nr:hypothetical protein [Deltaproteobacteria bacterium]